MAETSQTLPVEFQNQIIALVMQLIQAEVFRFYVFFPRQNLTHAAYSLRSDEALEDEYQNLHWHKDPMHPTLYEGTETIVVSNSMLMPLNQWKKTAFYQEFLKPQGYTHDMDTFFRKDGKIVGVLTLLRKDETKPFTRHDVATIEKLHPFMEYTLDKVFLPERITERQQLSEKYELTLRELDVMEYALSGLSNKELVRYLKISLPTLRTHLQHIYLKVGVHSTSELIATVLRGAHPGVFSENSGG